MQCNYQGPVCSNCRRRNEPCDYQLNCYSATSSTTPAVPTHVDLIPLGSSRVDYQIEIRTSANDCSYLTTCIELFVALQSLDYCPPFTSEQELLEYARAYFVMTDSTSPTLSNAVLSIWKQHHDSHVRRLEYLLPSISSLCAVYRTLQGAPQSVETYAHAIQHNITASMAFRHTEQYINESNWLSILMFGVGHIMFNFAAAQAAPIRDFDCLEIFRVLRGTARVGDQIGVFLEGSELSRLLESRRSVVKLSADDDALWAMDQIDFAEHPEGTPKLIRRSCDHALERLKWWFHVVDGCPQFWKQFIIWPASVTEGFVAALTEKQPVALLIYIYWCAIMHRAPKRWYAYGWHRRVAFAVMSELGSGYESLLVWPRTALGCAWTADTSLESGVGEPIAFFPQTACIV
ncbi:hypothetical protein F5Y19DRAFT_383734 [Xylariaceae sp. FL1651]|nr:hypothetical protein F5Y19DRAFT_383734 [Xylariaceae sp. FL1651]